MQCSLQVSDALQLLIDCIVIGTARTLYLRYFDHKTKCDALVPQ